MNTISSYSTMGACSGTALPSEKQNARSPCMRGGDNDMCLTDKERKGITQREQGTKF